ncbi:hypothetical protein SmJEL517_g02512 [Synchytrium microbalum]|uniref:non-specific serine/threonine protein kinase n=1 Tax=Synchytrium microbalum TaxID=1806994 RepID=A0A507C5T0_9FUNG|nr:uncharacterized protein SmJEL517_g02512 [Synchytrium microbalum]TPX35002.1 hypothetical protein SmJEL517_g02512 [Synchytrium microbalum]
MATINRLPKDTERRIASGQAQSSIQAVIKELIENALDAGARSINIKLERNGLDSIVVKDDGTGIPVAFFLDSMIGQRHCTSKITTFEDLNTLETFGFRGEALNSICNVSESVMIATKVEQEGEGAGRVYEFDKKGHITSTQRMAMDRGTSVTVRRVFNRIPVRRKNAASNQQKTATQVSEMVKLYAILVPQLRIVLKFVDSAASIKKDSEMNKPAAGTHLEAIAQTFGRAISSQLIELEESLEIHPDDAGESQEHVESNAQQAIEIRAVLPKVGADPTIAARSNADRVFMNVNGRPVNPSNKTLKDMIVRARDTYFSSMEPINGRRHPFLFVHIQVPTNSIDVNLEPDKSLVMLHNPNVILSCFQRLLKRAYPPESENQQVPQTLRTPVSNLKKSRPSQNRQKTSQNSPTKPRVLLGLINGQLTLMTSMTDESPGLLRMGRDVPETRVVGDDDDDDDDDDDEIDEESGQLMQSKRKRRRIMLEGDDMDLYIDETLKDQATTVDSVVYSSNVTLDSWLEKKRQPHTTPQPESECDESAVVHQQPVLYPLFPTSTPKRKPANKAPQVTPPANLAEPKQVVTQKRPPIMESSQRQLKLSELLAPRLPFKSKGREPVRDFAQPTSISGSTGSSGLTPVSSSGSQSPLPVYSTRDEDMVVSIKLSNLAERYALMVQDRLPAPESSVDDEDDEKAALDSRILIIGPISGSSGSGVFDAENSPVWTITVDGKVVVVNLRRMIEVLLFRELLSSGELPLKTLPYATLLRPQSVGGNKGLNFLQRVTSEEVLVPALPGIDKRRVSDPRLLANGFELYISFDTKNPKNEATVEVTSQTDAITSYGLGDLKELMASLYSRPIPATLELASTRPPRVIEYFVAQATSIARDKVKDISDVEWCDATDDEKEEIRSLVLGYVTDFFASCEDGVSDVPAGSEWLCPQAPGPMAVVGAEVLNKLLADIRSKNEDVRARGATDLRDYVVSVSREVSGETFSKFMNDVNRRIFELIQSNDVYDKIGGILAIDKLIDFDGEDNTTKITRFANYLRLVLPGTDPQIAVLAAKALGRLAQPGGNLTAEFVEFEVKRALEWLQGDRSEARRYAAVLVLRELAANAPIFIYSYVPQILDLIWVALRDSKVVIREGAAETLSATLDLVNQRESHSRRQWYRKIFDEAQKGFKMNTADAIHGSLLTLRVLLFPAATQFMDGRYREICDLILKYKDHRDVLIRKTVILSIPALATFETETFVTNYLNPSMNHLLGQLKKEKDRSGAFIAVGKVAIAVGSHVGPYLDSILQTIKEGLSIKGKNRGPTDAPIFQCISMLATAVGPALTRYIHELLDLMFAAGLTEPLRQALADLANHIQPLLPNIQERLLNMLSLILCGQPYRHPGAPPRMNGIIHTRDLLILEGRDQETIILALTTLGSFDFTGHILNEMVRDCAAPYLEDDDAEVRKAAAVTCCQLLARDGLYGSSTYAMQIVGEVLEKLLTVGISDQDSTIRQKVLSSLDERFDSHLAQAENVRSLFIALNDEIFPIRETAITIIGRLAMHNPAYVMPSLRKTLIQLLTELEYSGVSRHKEESARLLSHLISSAQRLIKPYVEPVLKVLISKVKDPSPGVGSKVLEAIGELAQVGCEDLLPYLDDLMPMIIETLQDQSSSTKREAALRTLGQLSSNTGWVIEPYLKYPNLLNLLINILKTEQSPAIRRETVKVMGILGALDPKHKMVSRTSDDTMTGGINSEAVAVPTGIAEDYYPTVAINSLMRILRDPSLSPHHTAVIQAVMYIFKTLGLKCVPFLPQILPPFLSVMGHVQNMLEFHFQQLSLLVSIVKQHIRNYLPEIFALIHEYWNPNASIQITILSLVEAVAVALDGEFKVHLPTLLPQMLQIFETDNSERRLPTQKVLHAMIIFGSNLEEYLHLVIPVIVKLFERQDVPVHLRRSAMQTIAQLCKKINFADQASRITHPLVRVLATGPPELKVAAMDTLSVLLYQLSSDFAIFVPMINKAMSKHHIQHARYEMLVTKLLKNEHVQIEMNAEVDDRGFSDMPAEETQAETSSKKLPVNQQNLKKAWEASQRSTKDDWAEWIRRFSVELLKESPSHALRACASLAASYPPLARELFNAGFVSCWSELYDQFQDELVRSLETALTSPNIPPEILQTLLNLAEFMEHDDKALPIDIRTLGKYAAKCHAFAKALHYKELEFISEPTPGTIENLISINNQLQQPDSAVGILTYAQQNHEVELKESWYEKLQRWEDALAAYERKQQEDPLSVEATLGRMRCLYSLGEWEALSQLAHERWPTARDDVKSAISSLASGAAWALGEWDVMEEYIDAMKQDSPDSAFFRAILALHRNFYPQSAQYIDKTRDLLDTELMALVGESYNRAYNVVVRIQMLAELEEIIQYKQVYDQPERQALIRKTWMKRLKGCQRNIDVWQRILKVRALVISPNEDMEMWIKFANLCRKTGRFSLSHRTLVALLNPEATDFTQQLDTVNNAPQVVYACLKHMWATVSKDHVFTQLKQFTVSLVQRQGLASHDVSVVAVANDPNRLAQMRLLARCYNKLGEWQLSLQEEMTDDNIPEILRSYRAATQCDKDWYKAWHAWALANFEVLSHYERSNETIPPEQLVAHAVPSVQGFFRSIALSKGNSLQDTLRLLTLWFKYGYQPDVNKAIGEGFNNVSVDTWLQVIPQLIARIHTPSPHVRQLIHQLLSDVGKEHPQALVYSLTVASKSTSSFRRDAAIAIMDQMRTHSAMLVEQALLVSQELIRVAILWHEMWHEGLEEASRLYFQDHNVDGMFATLAPLHQMMERGPETLREVSFNQSFGRDLQEALDWCRRYRRTLHINDLNQAWDLYYTVFRRINKQLPQLTTLELQYVSPALLEARDLELAIPGTYHSGEPVIKIRSFVATLTVITSKQRPRRLTIKGSDGKDYQYLLKGHEDLRQDERVMQLFGLVNTLLSTDPETFKRQLNIQRYPVIPLSPQSGLIGWVPNCDTLHTLIRDYRESRKILLNIEHRLMLQMAPDYDNLTLLQKVEVFEYALENTTGQDLYKVLWLKSKNSEVWLDRRTNYTRSLAVMSMVGYILGLGDRHPSNLMLDKFTGKVCHIDFGDCFEVAMHREKFPEKIPFRLTRMLINAMEVSGIEGNYRITCENVMRVLRENKDSLMAVLEAFVYDPLINWRLANNSRNDAPENDHIPAEGEQARPEALNARALAVITRVSNKLTGRDFKANNTLDVPSQVQRLILQATSLENLSQLYIGWCSFW